MGLWPVFKAMSLTEVPPEGGKMEEKTPEG